MDYSSNQCPPKKVALCFSGGGSWKLKIAVQKVLRRVLRRCLVVGFTGRNQISFEPWFGAYQGLAQKMKAPFSMISGYFRSFEGSRAISKPEPNPGTHQTPVATLSEGRGLRRGLRTGSKKGLWRRHLEGRNTSFQDYDPLRVRPISGLGEKLHIHHRPLNGPYLRGRLPPWRGARKLPISVNGAFPLLNGPFSDFNGPFLRMP